MINLKRTYTQLWISILVLFIGLCALLLLSFLENQGFGIFTAKILSWGLCVSSGLFLFLNSSKASLLTEKELKEKDKLSEKEPPFMRRPKSEHDKLDIQNVSKKIVKRINFNSPTKEWSELLLKSIVNELEIMSGIVYEKTDDTFNSITTYSYPHQKGPYSFKLGEGLNGQAAKNRVLAFYNAIPDDYTEVFSGLGSNKPAYLLIAPIVISEECKFIIEVSGFRWRKEKLDQIFQIISRDIAEKLDQNKATKDE